MRERFQHGYALLVGVGTTQVPSWSLPATVADMRALHRVLVDPDLCAYIDDDQHVRLLHDVGATRQAILEGLDWLRACAAADAEATVVLFFSGHGFMDPESETYYLVPHDMERHHWAKTALAAPIFASAIQQIEARRLLVVIDSCRAEGMATAKDEVVEPEGAEEVVQQAIPNSVLAGLKQGEGRAVFASSRALQKSYIRRDNKMSIYTYHFIEALQGAGNAPGDTDVRLSNLQNYVGKQVPQSAQNEYKREQRPFFDVAAEDFPIALLHGGKGLPAGGWNAVADAVHDNLRNLAETYHAGININVQGNRNVVAGRNMRGNTIITGDNNQLGGR